MPPWRYNNVGPQSRCSFPKRHRSFTLGDHSQWRDRLEQCSRRRNLEITGLLHSSGEALLDRVNEVVGTLALPPLTGQDVDAVRRLPARPGKTPNVINRFSSRPVKELWFSKKAQLREARPEIHFQENLVPQYKKLFWQLLAKAREINNQFVWIKDGKMFAIKGPWDWVLRIVAGRILSIFFYTIFTLWLVNWAYFVTNTTSR